MLIFCNRKFQFVEMHIVMQNDLFKKQKKRWKNMFFDIFRSIFMKPPRESRDKKWSIVGIFCVFWRVFCVKRFQKKVLRLISQFVSFIISNYWKCETPIRNNDFIRFVTKTKLFPCCIGSFGNYVFFVLFVFLGYPIFDLSS